MNGCEQELEPVSCADARSASKTQESICLAVEQLLIFLMPTGDLQRRQLIIALLARPPESVADDADNLWEQLATQIISIVGEDGFNALFTRALYLNRPAAPWLDVGRLGAQADRRFAELKMRFDEQMPAVANEANAQLLITFTDLLASLIGEQLTNRILALAWSTAISQSNGKES